MTVTASTAVRAAMMDALVSTIGASPTIEIWSSTAKLASFALGSTWGAQSSGIVTLSGLPLSATVTSTGVAVHYRLLSSGGALHLDGTVTDAAGGGDLVLDRTTLISGAPVRLRSCRIIAP